MPNNKQSASIVPHQSRRRVLAAAAGIGAASLGSATVTASSQEEDGPDEPFAGVGFSNQYSSGTEIEVDWTLLSDGGYVAIHDATLFEGQVAESVIGVSEYLEPGAHYGVSVTLFDVEGAEFGDRELEGTAPLVAMPHQETNDNETYDFVASGGEDDGAYAMAGVPVVDAGFVTVGEAADTEIEQFATAEFQNQAVEDGMVMVRDVTLSDGGFVTLHDAGLLSGDAIGSVVGVSEYLEPGRHQAVEVELDDPSAIAEVALPARPILAMPHLDTNDNQSYDFVDSEGGEDGPYTKAAQAVVSGGLVTVDE